MRILLTSEEFLIKPALEESLMVKHCGIVFLIHLAELRGPTSPISGKPSVFGNNPIGGLWFAVCVFGGFHGACGAGWRQVVGVRASHTGVSNNSDRFGLELMVVHLLETKAVSIGRESW